MKIEDKYIQTAINALTEASIVDGEGFYKEVFKGYISGLGASIMQAGLLPTVIFYENSPASEADKSKLIAAIIHVLNTDFGYTINGRFSQYILANSKRKEQVKLLKDVEKAVVAIKLALRIFNAK